MPIKNCSEQKDKYYSKMRERKCFSVDEEALLLGFSEKIFIYK